MKRTIVYISIIAIVFLSTLFSFTSGKLTDVSSPDSELPYPKSEYIKDIKFDWSTHRREASGSDNWQCTWADDDNIYCAFGDGGGFGGSNDLGRVSLGYSRIEGNYEQLYW